MSTARRSATSTASRCSSTEEATTPIPERLVEFYRELDEGPGPFRSFHFPDASQDGHRYWFKAVDVDGDVVALRQDEVGTDDHVHKYSWIRMDDPRGMLTDQPLFPDEEESIEISAEEFDRVGRRPPRLTTDCRSPESR